MQPRMPENARINLVLGCSDFSLKKRYIEAKDVVGDRN